jgi:integrase/recombinase XerD
LQKTLDNYINKLRSKKLSDNTIKSYVSDVKAFVSYIETEYTAYYLDVKKTQVLTYLVDLQKKGKSSSTIARNISSLKNFYDFLREERVISDNPIQNIHSPKQIKKVPLTLSEAEITKLMNLPDTKTFKGSRDSAILELLYSSGIKVTELINIRLDDINYNASIILIGKNNNEVFLKAKSRAVPIGTIALNAINDYLRNFRVNKSKEEFKYLFINNSGEALTRQGVWKILKYYERKLEINHELSPQVLRNSFAVHLLNNGADIASVQELMGHKNITAMQNYLQATQQKSLETFKNLHPRA